jgi:carbamoyltransferase
MYILGISAFYHDSAAALIKDGRVLYAVEEERFTRIKHDNQFPYQAVKFCLEKEDISIADIDYVTYYEKPLLKFERILENFVKTYPFSLRPFLRGIPEWFGDKIKIEQIIRKKLGYKGKLFFIPHHLSHAAASFYLSPFQKSAILTVDGVGEYQTTGLWYGEGNKITPIKSIDFPHSLGLLYSTFTAFLGFRVNEDEYKVMGLAAYGKPIYADNIYQIIDIKEDGSFEMNMKFFVFRESFRMWGKRFEKFFGKPRLRNQPVTQRDKDLAASIQKVTEDIYFRMLNHLRGITKCENVCIGGGVGLNALANGKIYTETPFKNIYIFGAAGDSGGAPGSALFAYHYILHNETRSPVESLHFGSEYADEEIERVLKNFSLNYEKIEGENRLIEKAADLLAKGKIIGWFQGRMEFGPRALGARSILSRPNPRKMKEEVNKIKIREQFRPFAGSILQEKVHEYFEVPKINHLSPFMTFCFKVKEEKREKLIAIVHKDNTCRIQTVNEDNGLYYKLIRRFDGITGVPCILNTSFNLKGEPIVENPQQAVEDFLKTEMDYLVIGKYLVPKSNRRE